MRVSTLNVAVTVSAELRIRIAESAPGQCQGPAILLRWFSALAVPHHTSYQRLYRQHAATALSRSLLLLFAPDLQRASLWSVLLCCSFIFGAACRTHISYFAAVSVLSRGSPQQPARRSQPLVEGGLLGIPAVSMII